MKNIHTVHVAPLLTLSHSDKGEYNLNWAYFGFALMSLLIINWPWKQCHARTKTMTATSVKHNSTKQIT